MVKSGIKVVKAKNQLKDVQGEAADKEQKKIDKRKGMPFWRGCLGMDWELECYPRRSITEIRNDTELDHGSNGRGDLPIKCNNPP